MHTCTVYFDSDLSEAETQLIVNAIRMLRGVASVESGSSTGNSRVQAVFNQDNSPPPPQPSSPPPSPSMPPPRQESSGQISSIQRQVIDKAISWAVRNRKISMAEIQKLSGEEIVTLAFKYIDMMPEEEKSKIGQDFSEAYGAGR